MPAFRPSQINHSTIFFVPPLIDGLSYLLIGLLSGSWASIPPTATNKHCSSWCKAQGLQERHWHLECNSFDWLSVSKQGKSGLSSGRIV